MKTYLLVTIENRKIVGTRKFYADTDQQAIGILIVEEQDADEEVYKNWRRYELRDGNRLVLAW